MAKRRIDLCSKECGGWEGRSKEKGEEKSERNTPGNKANAGKVETARDKVWASIARMLSTHISLLPPPL